MMKETILSILSATLVAVASFADDIQLPHIMVYGTATTEVTPDEMIWSVKVQNMGASLEAVANEHTKNVGAVLRFLKESKVDDKTLQTSRMEFGENWEYRSNSRVREGYFASTSVSFKITDFELYEKLWIGLARMSAVSVEGVTYDHSKRIEYRNETRQKAVLAAKEKAITIAKSLGAEIGEPLLVEEDIAASEGWSGNLAVQAVNNLSAIRDEERGGHGALSPGTIPIRARVKAAFRLVAIPK